MRTPLELSEVATALYDRISTVTPDDVSVFGMSNPQPPAEPTLGEQVSDRIAAAHRLRAPVGAALE